MISHKLNGDIYFGPIRVFNSFTQSPPFWLMLLGAATTLLAGWAAIWGLHIVFDLFME